ncbi:hypothetical protein CSOJ01_11474 [Colletotrichum sojae]|uniref:Uncharacterized protein n=1 Tax=Colletotrichum sojae TaxID=2175907 RepID=A0A8H6MNM6_9PEZI|nr:hypothetical protein CSOJ01_11474 [Colletotrichum sojae]
MGSVMMRMKIFNAPDPADIDSLPAAWFLGLGWTVNQTASRRDPDATDVDHDERHEWGIIAAPLDRPVMIRITCVVVLGPGVDV